MMCYLMITDIICVWFTHNRLWSRGCYYNKMVCENFNIACRSVPKKVLLLGDKILQTWRSFTITFNFVKVNFFFYFSEHLHFAHWALTVTKVYFTHLINLEWQSNHYMIMQNGLLLTYNKTGRFTMIGKGVLSII